MIDVYIDESGNQGTSGKYFVIAAIVCSEAHSVLRIKRIFKQACLDYSSTRRPLKEIKGNSLKFRQHQELLNKVALRTDHEIFVLIEDKTHTKSNLDHNQYYSYLSGVLIKRILKKYNDDIRITFDARDVKATSLTSLADYIKIKAEVDWNFEHKLEIIRRESHTVYCLQAADLIAHVTYKKYTYGGEHLFNIMRSRVETTLELPLGKFGK